MPGSLARFEGAEIFKESPKYKPVERDKVERIGNITLSKEEEDILSVRPDFALFANMIDEFHDNEVIAEGIKHMWECSNG